MSVPKTLPLIRVITVECEANGLRVDRYLRDKVQVAPSVLFKLLRKKTITQINTTQSKRLQGSDRVFAGMQIKLPNSLLSPSDNSKQQINAQKLPFLYESASMAVIQKPYGLACQGGTKVTSSVDTILPPEYRLVHRLDRHTTGALVVARTRLAASALAKAFHDRNVDKTYIALLKGIPKCTAGTINHALVNNGEMVGLAGSAEDGAKAAITRYKVLKTGVWNDQQLSLVELDILTGRKHQIRVHCAKALGCPVLGDSRYSATGEKTKGHMYLHLFRIKIPNVDEQGKVGTADASTVTVTAPFPLFWQQAFSSLGVKFSSK
ncbi:hypothetical protein IWW45_001533 [Coemansia sp. RSA 485]|nr:hypothetical protein IWW45_001533 [Coemansia sp. RSA 485]